MKVSLYSVEETVQEIELIVNDPDMNIRLNTVRYARAEYPHQKDPPFLSFDYGLMISFVVDVVGLEPMLYEFAKNYGKGVAINSERFKEEGQPQNVREVDVVTVSEFLENQDIRFCPGRVDLSI